MSILLHETVPSLEDILRKEHDHGQIPNKLCQMTKCQHFKQMNKYYFKHVTNIVNWKQATKRWQNLQS